MYSSWTGLETEKEGTKIRVLLDIPGSPSRCIAKSGVCMKSNSQLSFGVDNDGDSLC